MERYTKHLLAMNEPSLWELSGTNLHTYRFLWLRSFHEPICMRLIIEQDRTGWQTTKILTKSDTWEIGVLEKEKKVKITQHQVETFLNKLEQAGFWRMPSIRKQYSSDGAGWIIEGRKDSQYHIVERICPWILENPEKVFSEAGLLLIEYSGVPIDNIY
jgi:hypothetical protein